MKIYPFKQCPYRSITECPSLPFWFEELSLFEDGKRLSFAIRKAKKIYADLSGALFHKRRMHLLHPTTTQIYAPNDQKAAIHFYMEGYNKWALIGIKDDSEKPLLAFSKNYDVKTARANDAIPLYTQKGDISLKTLNLLKPFAESA